MSRKYGRFERNPNSVKAKRAFDLIINAQLTGAQMYRDFPYFYNQSVTDPDLVANPKGARRYVVDTAEIYKNGHMIVRTVWVEEGFDTWGYMRKKVPIEEAIAYIKQYYGMED